MNDRTSKIPPENKLSRWPYRSAELPLAAADVTTIAAFEDDWWRCDCGNVPHEDGFVPVDRQGREVEPTPAQWPKPLYACCRCGLVMDAATVDLVTGTVAVIGRVVL